MPNAIKTVDFVKTLGRNIAAAAEAIKSIDDKEIGKEGRAYLYRFTINMGEMYAQAVLQATIASSYIDDEKKADKKPLKLSAKDSKKMDEEWTKFF